MLCYDCCTVVFWRTPATIILHLDGCWDTAIVDYIDTHKNLLLNMSGFFPSRTGLDNGPQVKAGLLLVSVNKISCKRSSFHLWATCGFHTVKAKVYSKENISSQRRLTDWLPDPTETVVGTSPRASRAPLPVHRDQAPRMLVCGWLHLLSWNFHITAGGHV